MLASKIMECKEFKVDSKMAFLSYRTRHSVPQQFFDRFTAQHRIFENIYIGNLRAFMSINPQFLEEKFQVTDFKKQFLGDYLLPDEELVQYIEEKLDKKGCSELGIRWVLSTTQFKPDPNLPINDWTHFDPKVETMGVQCMRLAVDDDEFAWKNIKPLLAEAFNFIDKARSKGEPMLIHCVKGASLSITILTAYLMNRCEVSWDQAFNFIQTHRPTADLNHSIKRGLKQYERELARESHK